MSTHVCPWWLGPLLASPVRKLVQDPARILAPHVREGMTVLEPGPGMGFFTIELARRVGPRGRVIAVERKSGALFQEAVLEPKVDLGRLEEVVILMNSEPRQGFETGSRQQP